MRFVNALITFSRIAARPRATSVRPSSICDGEPPTGPTLCCLVGVPGCQRPAPALDSSVLGGSCASSVWSLIPVCVDEGTGWSLDCWPEFWGTSRPPWTSSTHCSVPGRRRPRRPQTGDCSAPLTDIVWALWERARCPVPPLGSRRANPSRGQSRFRPPDASPPTRQHRTAHPASDWQPPAGRGFSGSVVGSCWLLRRPRIPPSVCMRSQSPHSSVRIPGRIRLEPSRLNELQRNAQRDPGFNTNPRSRACSAGPLDSSSLGSVVVAHWLRWKAVLVGVEVPASGRVQHAGGPVHCPLQVCAHRKIQPCPATVHLSPLSTCLPAAQPASPPGAFSLWSLVATPPVPSLSSHNPVISSTPRLSRPSSPLPPLTQDQVPFTYPQSSRPPDFHSPPFFLPCPVIPLRPRLTTGRAWRRVPGSSLSDTANLTRRKHHNIHQDDDDDTTAAQRRRPPPG